MCKSSSLPVETVSKKIDKHGSFELKNVLPKMLLRRKCRAFFRFFKAPFGYKSTNQPRDPGDPRVLRRRSLEFPNLTLEHFCGEMLPVITLW